MSTVLIDIPSPVASSSKMAKKGWKCWAKILTEVASPANDGFAFKGQFVTVGAEVEACPGDVILHVDQSSSAGIGIVYANSRGMGRIKWIQTTDDSSGREWCGAMGKTARWWLELTPETRLRELAKILIADNAKEPKWSPAALEHYTKMAQVPAQEPAAPSFEALVAEREQILRRLAEIDLILYPIEEGAK